MKFGYGTGRGGSARMKWGALWMLAAVSPAAHALSNGQDAIDVFGQLDSSGTPSFTQNLQDLSSSGLSRPYDVKVDEVNHRLFVADTSNARVLIFNLDENNRPIDRHADFVLGQADFVSNAQVLSSNGLRWPYGLAWDPLRRYLFVADERRVLVYDLTAPANHQSAIRVLGQSNFTSMASTTSATGFSTVEGLDYDPVHQRLFVADYGNARVMVFDVADITNGEAAVAVLGQAGFGTSASTRTASGFLAGDMKVLYDKAQDRLFVSDFNSGRVMIFDVSTVTNGEPAQNVLGKPTFVSTAPTNGAAGFLQTGGLAYDEERKTLFVTEYSNSRVLVFDLNEITDGEPAVNVLGQPDFDTYVETTTKSGLTGPYAAAYGPASGRLYVMDYDDNRVVVYQVAAPASATVEQARSYPNPFRPGRGHTDVTVDRLPSNATVKVYALGGALVRTLTASALGAVSWDGKNDSGEPVASGVYYGFAESGGDSKTFKIVVQR